MAKSNLKTNSCKDCKYNIGLYCNVGSKYAEKGQKALCYNGELWEGNEAYRFRYGM